MPFAPPISWRRALSQSVSCSAREGGRSPVGLWQLSRPSRPTSDVPSPLSCIQYARPTPFHAVVTFSRATTGIAMHSNRAPRRWGPRPAAILRARAQYGSFARCKESLKKEGLQYPAWREAKGDAAAQEGGSETCPPCGGRGHADRVRARHAILQCLRTRPAGPRFHAVIARTFGGDVTSRTWETLEKVAR